MTDRPAEAPVHAASVARTQALPWLLLIVLLALAGWLAYKAFWPRDPGDPVATTIAAFEKQNRLTVFSAQLAPVVANTDERLFGLIESSQVAVIPARVDYSLDLSGMDRNRLTWNATDQVLDVRLPALSISKPNLDESGAQYLTKGVWVSREAQGDLTRANTRSAEKQASEQAANPVLLGLARGAAKEAIRQNLTIPLQVAGYRNAVVTVRFDGEKTIP